MPKITKISERRGKITKDMALGEIVARYPEAAMVMFRHGLHCAGCHAAAFETLEQGAKAHGMSDSSIAKMLKEMNGSIADRS